MQTLQTLQKRIVTTGKLQSIVKSMKTLSAVNIRQYERAVASLDSYLKTIELGLQVAMREYPVGRPRPASSPSRGLVVFGSDQGLCGRFNENLVQFIEQRTDQWQTERGRLAVLAIGARVAARLEGAGFVIEERFWVPGSIHGINTTIYQILQVLERWQQKGRPQQVEICFNRHQAGTAGEPYMRTLLPVDNIHLRELSIRKWPGRTLPRYAIDAERLFKTLLHQYLFVSLFRAQAESLESEQASRLRSMQSAEKNIAEHLEELRAQYSLERQTSITAELLDLVAGFRSVAGNKNEEEKGYDPGLIRFLDELAAEVGP